MRNQIIALKYKADSVIAVSIPVGILILFGRFSIDNQITACILVKTAYDIEQCSLSTAGLSKY